MKELKVEYERYLKEVVQALESDPEFRKKLETAKVEDIKNGKIARELHLVNHKVRTQLDELKRRELERLRHIALKEHEKKSGVDRSKLKMPVHLDARNPDKFEAEDLKKLILQLNHDLELADEQRRKEFKNYELEKEYQFKHSLNEMDDEHKKQAEKEHDEQQKKHKEHPKLHHPGSKQQLEEVWEEQDHMNAEDFDPRVFFPLHDLDGNGYWDENEVKLLFQKELDKMYDPNAPEDDLNERYEEMERMREHVFRETDTDGNKLISFEEFLEQTRKSEFERDEGWQGIDEQELYSQQEYEEYERQRQIEIQKLIESGAIPPPPGYYGINHPQPLVMEAPSHAGVGIPPAPLPSVGSGPNIVPQGYQQVPQGYQAVPQGYQVVPQGYQSAPQGQRGVPQGYQGQQAVPQGYQVVPQQQQAVPQGYQAVPQGYQAVPQGHQAVPPGYQAVPQSQSLPQNYQGVPQGPPNIQQAQVGVDSGRSQGQNSNPNIAPSAQGVPIQKQGVPQAQAIPQAQALPQAQAIPQAQALPHMQNNLPQGQTYSQGQASDKKVLDNQGQQQEQPPGVVLQKQQDSLNHHPEIKPVADNRLP